MRLQFWKKPEAAPASSSPTRRQYANQKAALRMFESAKTNRLNNDWGVFPMTADAIIFKHQRIIVARSREQAANNDYGRAFLRMCRQNIVGAGITLQAAVKGSDKKLDPIINAALEEGFCKWGKKDTADIAGKQSWRALQLAAVVSAAKDGEYMFRTITGKKAGAFGFALQLLDPQRCPVDFDRFDLGGGSFIRSGIEYNEWGRPQAYYFNVVKESDAFWNYQYAGNSYHRIPADEIIHGYLEEMANQKRGLPWMATALFRMKQLNAFEDAAIVNARVGAAKMGFFEWEEGTGPPPDDEDVAPEIEAEAGMFHELPPGLHVKEFSPQYPANEFAPFMKQGLRSMAAGLGVPYNELAADLEGVNFSSIRQGTLDSREHWKELQEWLTESLSEVVYARWLKQALLRGMIVTEEGLSLPAHRYESFLAVTWQPRRWQWIDPRADVDGAVESKNNMLASPGQLIREQGRDPSTVWTETARDMRSMIDALMAEGIDEKEATQFVLLSMGRPVPPPPKPDAPPPAKQGK